MSFLPPNQQRESTEGKTSSLESMHLSGDKATPSRWHLIITWGWQLQSPTVQPLCRSQPLTVKMTALWNDQHLKPYHQLCFHTSNHRINSKWINQMHKCWIHKKGISYQHWYQTKSNKSSPKWFGNSALPPSRQRMDLPAAYASCAMSTADESNHSAAGTLHPQRSATSILFSYTACLIPPIRKKFV